MQLGKGFAIILAQLFPWNLVKGEKVLIWMMAGFKVGWTLIAPSPKKNQVKGFVAMWSERLAVSL